MSQLVCGMRERGRWWFRIFGYGLWWVDRTRHPKVFFNERYGLTKVWYLGDNQGLQWAVKVLRPSPHFNPHPEYAEQESAW